MPAELTEEAQAERKAIVEAEALVHALEHCAKNHGH